jgi:GNAT superfamily N-acetyltransferase
VEVHAHEVVARIPSWMRDPARACPTTTYYRSVIARGSLRSVEDPEARAAALQRMMEERQPEGRHVPISAADPLYAAAVRGLGVWRVDVAELHAVEKLGQDQTAEHVRGIVRALWERGGPGDHAAIEVISAAHPDRPAFAAAPPGLRARCWPSPADARAAAKLAAGRYWNATFDEDTLAQAVLGSTAWVGLEQDGALVASARAISDRAKRSWVYDVVVRDELQRAGLGSALMRLLLDHPAVRSTEVSLATRDAAGFYARLGFEAVFTDTRGAYPRTMMRRPPSGR